jgi:hypothetical protein
MTPLRRPAKTTPFARREPCRVSKKRRAAQAAGVATRQPRRQKPRFLPPETKLMSGKIAKGDFSQ